MDALQTQKISAPRAVSAGLTPTNSGDRQQWLESLKGMGDQTAATMGAAVPKDSTMDSVRRWLNPNHLSEGDKQKARERIQQAAERLRGDSSQAGLPHERAARATGMSLEEARKLEAFAHTTKDAELLREARFLVQMLTDSRPSLDVPRPDPGQQRTLPLEHYQGSQARCAASAARRHPELRGDNLVRTIWAECGGG